MPFFLVQLAFKLGDGGVLLAVPAMCVEHLQESGEDRVLSVGTARGISLAAYVEKDALRRRADRPFDKSFKERQFFLPFAEGDEDIRSLRVAYVMIFEDGGEDFEEVRFTGTEESRNPRTVGVTLVIVLEKRFKIRANLIRDDEFL